LIETILEIVSPVFCQALCHDFKVTKCMYWQWEYASHGCLLFENVTDRERVLEHWISGPVDCSMQLDSKYLFFSISIHETFQMF
jgi:hypothetical protein